MNDINRTWWEILEDCQRLTKEVQEILAGPTMSEEQLDLIASTLADVWEAQTIARRHLGLPE